MVSKDKVSCTNIDIELLEDSNMTDSGETSVEEINDTINGNVSTVRLRGVFPYINVYFYLQNTYEIYLGLNTPPPKYF